MRISVFLEIAPIIGSSVDCLEYYWGKLKNSTLKIENVHKTIKGNFAILDYNIKEYEGRIVNQKHINNFIVLEDIWIDFHISMRDYEIKHKTVINNVLRSIKFEKNKFNSLDLLKYGNLYFQHERYNMAIVLYNRALELENKSQKFSDIDWLNISEGLGLAYGISGEYKKALRTFKFGISIDDSYPMFYYNLAYIYADLGDYNNALAYLTQFNFRKENLPGDKICPNPLKEKVFQPLFNDNRFLKIAKEIARSISS